MTADRNGKNLARFAEAIAYLMKQPRSPRDLAVALESRSSAQAYAYLDALHGEGLIYILEWRPSPRGAAVPVYAWQDSVCGCPDAPRPVPLRYAGKSGAALL